MTTRSAAIGSISRLSIATKASRTRARLPISLCKAAVIVKLVLCIILRRAMTTSFGNHAVLEISLRQETR